MPIVITTSATVTANDIIRRALLAIGYLGRGEPVSAQDAVDGLNTFNAMLDSWTNESLVAYVTVQRSFPLQAGKQTYTIGTVGSPDINTARPFDIIQAFIRDTNNNDYGLAIIPQDVWNDIGEKNITSQIPNTLFYYSAYPLGEINIFPVPLLPYTVFYTSTLDQVDFSLLTTTLSMPLGYERAYILNLALELMGAGFPCLLDQPALALLIANAKEAKANIKRTNIKEVLAQYDPYVVSRSNATYNIYSDGYPRGPN